jgi:transcriptional regulator with XRE-family HTH domain
LQQIALMAKSNKQHVGNTIRILRTLAGMSQTQLADEIGKTRGMVSHIERQGKVNHYTLKDIAKALNTTVERIEQYPITKNERVFDTEDTIDKLTTKIQQLQREIELLNDLVNHQKKIIGLLEKNLPEM